MKEILDILPKDIYDKISNIENLNNVQEIRLNINKPLIVIKNNKEIILDYKVLINDLKVPLNNSCKYYTVSWNAYSYL